MTKSLLHGNQFCCIPFSRSAKTQGDIRRQKTAPAAPLYSEGVMSNDWITASLNAAGGGALGLSEGSVYSFRRKLAEASGESIRYLHKNRIEKKPEMDDQWK